MFDFVRPSVRPVGRSVYTIRSSDRPVGPTGLSDWSGSNTYRIQCCKSTLHRPRCHGRAGAYDRVMSASLRGNEMRGIELLANATRGNGLRVIVTQPVFAVTRCPSVCLSVRLSVTLVYCIQTAEDIVKFLSRPGSQSF